MQVNTWHEVNTCGEYPARAHMAGSSQADIGWSQREVAGDQANRFARARGRQLEMASLAASIDLSTLATWSGLIHRIAGRASVRHSERR
jgi:hypothetical protein